MRKEINTIFFAHSAGAQYGEGKGSYGLVKSLRSKLKGTYRILYPKVRKPGTPSYAKYKKLYAEAFDKLRGPVILIGHSLGSSTLIKYLSEEKPDIPVAGLFLIATPFWKSNMKEFQLKRNFQASMKKIPAIYLYQSKNDPEVPFKHLEFYRKSFRKAIVRVLPGKEHIFPKGIPQLVLDIETIIVANQSNK